MVRRILFTALLALACLSFGQGKNLPPKVELRALGTFGAAQPGKAELKVTFADGLHGYQNPPSESYMIPVAVSLPPTSTFKLGAVKYPKGEPLKVGGSEKPVAVYSGSVTIPLSLTAPAAKGKATLTVLVDYQQCNEKSCYPPAQATATLDLDVAEKAVFKDDVGTSGAETTGFTSDLQDKAPATGLAGFIQGAFSSGNYFVVLPLLFLAGLLINLTPCVYPLVPVTISFFSNQSEGDRKARLRLGMIYSLGIALTYGALGGIAAGLGHLRRLFENRWFLVALGLLMVGLGLAMFDLYQIGIPAPLARQLKGRSGPTGALIMGTLVGVAAAPCAGPLIVAILAEIAKLRSVPLGVGLFTLVGAGLALPYLVLSALSSGAKGLPKAGGWMKTVKALLGLLVLGMGMNYFVQAFGRELGPQGASALWVLFYAASSLYLLFFERAAETRSVFVMKGVALLLFGALLSGAVSGLHPKSSGGLAWKEFSAATFEEAKRSGKPIVIDASANWCALCHEIDERVFDKPEVVAAMQDAVALKIDWSTGVDEKYKAETKSLFAIQGLPHIVILKPGGEASSVRNDLQSPAEFLDLLARATPK